MRRTAAVRSLDYATLSKMSKSDFLELLSEFPQIEMNFRNNLSLYEDEDLELRRNFI